MFTLTINHLKPKHLMPDIVMHTPTMHKLMKTMTIATYYNQVMMMMTVTSYGVMIMH